MPFYAKDAEFEDLDYRDRRDLINALNDNSTWREIATYVVEVLGLDRREWIDDVEREVKAQNATDSPAELLLSNLRSRECDVYTLCRMLEACKLFDALSIISDQEDLEIIKQPNPNANKMSYKLAIGEIFSITCEAKGLPPPKYQWFHENVEVHGQTSSTLNMLIERADQGGEYRCAISQFSRGNELLHFEYSNYVILVIKPTPVEITKQPVSVKVLLGKDFSLSCEAKAHPNPTYQWYKNNDLLNGQNSSTLQIEKFKRDHKGEYYCIVSNPSDSKSTIKVEVKEDYPPQKAKDKIALLIANSQYQYYDKLGSAENDAALMATLLQKMGFKVMCLRNLTLREMQNIIKIFCSILTQGTYGVLYFVGHGFKMHSVHMMPIDIPETYLIENAYSQDEFLSLALAKKPALLVVILDMCLTVPDKKSNLEIYKQVPKIYEAKSYNNLFLAYSTSSYNQSYEQKNARNGVYVTELAKHITLNKPVGDVFIDVARGIKELTQRTSTPSDQNPMITSVPGESFRCLTDPLIYEISESPTAHQLYLTDLITFRPKKVQIKFKKCEVSCHVNVQSPNPPFLNVILLTVSELEEWDISFHNSAGNQAELYPLGRKCFITNPQRKAAGVKGSLVISIGKNRIVHDSIRFPYGNYVAKIVHLLDS